MAFLVDGDSAPASLAAELLAETAKYGPAVVRRVYGDWGSSNMNTWRTASRDLALTAVHHTSNISGKNSTDISLVIDAVDLFHQKNVKGFCLVTSDSDFTQLATFLRERGMFVMAIGRKQTPTPLKQACDVFVLVENLGPAKGGRRAPSDEPPARVSRQSPARRVAPRARSPSPRPARGRNPGPARSTRGTPAPTRSERIKRPVEEALPLLKKAFAIAENEEGFAHMSQLHAALRRLDSAFDSRTYGKRQLIDLVRMFPRDLEVWHPRGEAAGVVVVRRAHP
jgi:uncharacterized LabA/DUF88 family protein